MYLALEREQLFCIKKWNPQISSLGAYILCIEKGTGVISKVGNLDQDLAEGKQHHLKPGSPVNSAGGAGDKLWYSPVISAAQM